ncbi:terpene synthase family protein [Chitinophaga nivalis]|uniref:Terpene synthase n=1 Tax=Chitinophaga nivalis TaxID=2991709 RepID=A0ABT3ITG5_9BACT|nr:terpene synthase family protein [Chitinophaga nivalis]MCW3463034.1 terpene synthase family protein [Chitinophaga nivalis]MCW3487276.1 terpene synthase family protein [Chitinophaga nivalis]
MEKQLFDELIGQAPILISPHRSRLEQVIRDWILHDLHLADDDKKKLIAINVAAANARMFARAAYDPILIASRLLLFFFVVDDPFELQSEAAIIHTQQPYITLLNGGTVPDEDAGCVMLRVILQELKACNVSTAWMQRFVASLKIYFQGVREESIWRSKGIHPDPDTYLTMRVKSGIVDAYYNLVEIGQGIELNEADLQIAALQQINYLSSRAWILDNELASMEKEKADLMNYINVLQFNSHIPRGEAIRRTIDKRHELLAAFNHLRQHPDVADPKLQQYIDGLELLIYGVLCWYYMDTPRYDT